MTASFVPPALRSGRDIKPPFGKQGRTTQVRLVGSLEAKIKESGRAIGQLVYPESSGDISGDIFGRYNINYTNQYLGWFNGAYKGNRT
jgi:hypothetical protein